MRKFNLGIATTVEVTVPDEFIKTMRSMANQPESEAGPFLTKINKEFADDDDAFILAVLKNGTRIRVRDALLDLYGADGLGVRLSPAQVVGEPRMPVPSDATPEVVTPKQIPVALELPE